MCPRASVTSAGSREVQRSQSCEAGVAGLERKATVARQGCSDCGQRTAQVVVPDQGLERMAGHHHQVEFAVPGRRVEVAQNPFDPRNRPGLLDHPDTRIEAAQPPRVAGLTGFAEHGAGAAADVEHRAGRHHQGAIEREIRSAGRRREEVVEFGERGVIEVAIDHELTPPTAA